MKSSVCDRLPASVFVTYFLLPCVPFSSVLKQLLMQEITFADIFCFKLCGQNLT